MKNKKLSTICLIGLFGVSLLTGCNNEFTESSQTSEQEAVSISLNLENATMDLFENLQLNATIMNTEEVVSWTSSNQNVALVNDAGIVTSVGEGIATITATVANKSDTCQITVTAQNSAVFSLDVEELQITPLQTYELMPSLTYAGKNLDATYSFETENAEIAIVNNEGVVEGVKCGETTLTVTANYYSINKTTTISVNVIPDIVVTLNKSEVILGSYDTDEYDLSETLVAAVVSNGEEVINPAITWRVDNSQVATVNNGLVNAVNIGQTKVYAEYSEDGSTVAAEALVKVVRPTITGTLTNSTINFDASESDKAELDLTGLDQLSKDLVSITIPGEESHDVPFEINNNKVLVNKSSLKVGGNTLLIAFTKVAFTVTVRVICNDATLMSFDSASDVERISIYWNDAHSASFDSEVKMEGENGSLKITYNQEQAFNYILLNKLLFSDVYDFDYIEFNVYNPTQHEFDIQPTWVDGEKIKANGWTNVKFSVGSIKAEQITNMAGTLLTAYDISSYAICFYGPGFMAGDSIYFSSFKATKELANEIVVHAMDTIDATANLNIFNGTATAEFDSSIKYGEENGSLKVTHTTAGETYIGLVAPTIKDISKFDHISFRVYNDTDHEIQTGVLWAKDTTVLAGEWAEVTISVAEFDEINVTDFSAKITKTNITGFSIRLMGGWANGDVCHISNVVLYREATPQPELGDVALYLAEQGSTNLNIFNGSASAEFDSSIKYGEENGSLKVTHTTAGETYIALIAPTVTNISSYDHISFRVYNDTDHAIQTGVLWAKDTTVPAGEWAEVTISVAEFDSLNIQALSGADIATTDITGFALRLMGGWANGDVCHISNVMLYKDPITL